VLPTGRWRVRFSMRSLNFSIDVSFPAALGSTKPLTEMSTRNLLGAKGRPARKADNLTAIYEPIVQKMWEPGRLTTLWAFTSCYRNTFTFTFRLHGATCKKILLFRRSLLCNILNCPIVLSLFLSKYYQHFVSYLYCVCSFLRIRDRFLDSHS
jgi:hypothetical protein